MNSKLMIILAGVMLAGAIVAGYLGIKASASPQKQAMQPAGSATDVQAGGRKAAENGRYAVVVAGRELPAGMPIKPEDLYIEHLRQVPPQSYERVEELVGKRPMVAIPVGALVTEAAMLPGGQLSKLVKPGERAMAIAVDEVVGGGGFVRPGDFVDVLLYAKESGSSRDRADNSAQVVLSALRVISYGPRLAPAEVDPQSKEEKKEEAGTARTAVLAVPDSQMTKLVLASNEGVLRLAVRSALEPVPALSAEALAAEAKEGKSASTLAEKERRLITAADILPGRAAAPVRVVARSTTPRQPQTAQAPAPSKPSVIIQRGSAVQQQLVP